MLATHAGVQVVGEAANAGEALAAVERLSPDVVILDIYLPGPDGIALTEHIKARWPSIRVVVHSFATERSEDVLKAGADAFVAKGEPPDQLLKALCG
jgi:DNA-binding NarL/FixJ family response regulator